MTELKMKTAAEVEDFTDELSDEYSATIWVRTARQSG